MPRQPRLDAPGALHHVIGRGINGVKIFDSRKDREDFLERRTFIGSTFLFIQGQGQFSLKSFGILIGVTLLMEE